MKRVHLRPSEALAPLTLAGPSLDWREAEIAEFRFLCAARIDGAASTAVKLLLEQTDTASTVLPSRQVVDGLI